MIPYLDPAFPPWREAIQEKNAGAVRGVWAAAAASVAPTRGAWSFVNECKKWMASSPLQRERRQKRKLLFITEYSAESQTALLPSKLWMPLQWPLYFFLLLFSHFSKQIHELLMTPNASFLTSEEMGLYYNNKRRLYSAIFLFLYMLRLWWQRGRIKLYFLSGKLRKWTWILSFHEDHIPKVTLILTSCSIWWAWHQKERRGHGDQIINIHAYCVHYCVNQTHLCETCSSQMLSWARLSENGDVRFPVSG